MARKHKINIKESHKSTNWPQVFLILIFIVALVYLLSILFPDIIIKKPKYKPVSLYLVTNGKEFLVNDLIEVDVYLDNYNKKSSGVDLVLHYDPSYLELRPLKRNELTGTVITGNAILDLSQNKREVRLEPHSYLNTQASSFELFPFLKVDTLNGLIYFSALAKPLVGVEGRTSVASLLFTAKRKGSTRIDIVFEKGSNTDSNVAHLGKDILEEVQCSDIVIR